jgi:hemerythrin
MRQHRYPGLEEHQKEHESLIVETKEIAHYFASGARVDVGSLGVNFRDWWLRHIRTTDKELCLFLTSKGLK